MVRSVSKGWWVLAAAAPLQLLWRSAASAEVPSSFLSGSFQVQADPSPAKPAQDIPGAGTNSTTKKNPAKKAATGKKTTASSAKRHYADARKPRTVSPRVRRMRQAFVASASLRPMAQQLLQDRSLPAYAGVQAYARAHAKEDAGALAWLVLGYAHVLDKDYAQSDRPAEPRQDSCGRFGRLRRLLSWNILPGNRTHGRGAGHFRRLRQSAS